MKSTATIALLSVYATTSYASWGGYYNNGDDSSTSTSNEPYSSGNGGDSSGDFDGSGFSSFGFGSSFSSYHKKLIAHAVLATVAFGFMFPAGGILMYVSHTTL